ncbi:MAG TPA: HEAT repeat domain-containing protein, partial [Candidatus Angelobacter sp.]|nr:HEAT repeat domain-containing protein [Candidatus Angelobacter sp.]
MRVEAKIALVTLLSLSLVLAASGQKPNVSNAKIEELSAAQGLKPAIDALLSRNTGPFWIGYKIPTAPKEGSICCWQSNSLESHDGRNCCLGCRMDRDHDGDSMGTDSNCSPLEPKPYAFVLLRADEKKIAKVRLFSAECPLDFAGMQLEWLNDVKPEESVAMLTAMAQESSDEEQGGNRNQFAIQIVMAIAFHNVPAADTALEKLIQPNQPEKLRSQVAFWAATERGKTGLELLQKYVVNDKDDRFRREGTFALSQSKQPGAIETLIGMARHDPSPRVRGQAIFWMAQMGGRKEAGQI